MNSLADYAASGSVPVQGMADLIARLESGPVYLTHKEAYDIAIWFGPDVALGMASLIRKAVGVGSLDAALALCERVMGEAFTLDLLQDVLKSHDADGLSIKGIPLALCASALRATHHGNEGRQAEVTKHNPKGE